MNNKNQTPKAAKPLEDKLQMIADIIELLLNYLVLLCLLNGAGAVGNMLNPPLWYWFLPLVYPFYYWFLREKMRYLSLFLLLHLPVAIVMPALSFQLNHDRYFWIVTMILSSLIYTVHSIYARIREKKTDSVPYGMAMAIAVVAFLLAAYLGVDLACTRIMVCGVAYVFLWLIRNYLEYFSNYLSVNRSAAGAMPEKSILQVSLRNVLISTTGVTALLVAVLWSPLSSWLTEFAKDFGFLLLKGIASILMLFSTSKSEGEEIMNSDPSMGGAQMMGGMDGEPSLLMLILEKVLFVVAILVAVALIVLGIMALARFLMEGFYEKRGVKREVEREGFLEEEERISRKQGEKSFRLPVLGGTPEQKVRRIFWKAVLSEYEKRGIERIEKEKTARQLAEKFSDEKAAEWTALAGLYDKARYGNRSVTKEESRQAGVLARQIRK